MHMTFIAGLKKEDENSTTKFLFLSVDDYERLLSFISEAFNGIKYADASMKLSPLLQTNCG